MIMINEHDINMNNITLDEESIKVDISSDNEITEIMCQECSVVVKDKGRLVKHRREQHKPHICSDCGRMFYGRKKLNIHHSLWHRIHKKKPCPNCNIVFTSIYLAQHISKCKPKQSGRKLYDLNITCVNLCWLCTHSAVRRAQSLEIFSAVI